MGSTPAPEAAPAAPLAVIDYTEEVVEEFVYMSHPDIKSIAGPIRKTSADTLWAIKGWKICPPPPPKFY